MTPAPAETHTLQSLADLDVWARRTSSRFQAGHVVGLSGPMGAGKTTLVQALTRALNVDTLRETVASPTFVLMHDYLSGRLPILHADLYRLGEDRSGEAARELLDAIASRQSLVLIEWVELADFLTPCLTHHITLQARPDDSRLLTLRTMRQEPDPGSP
ncbi:MAG: tRNA (adenosine(37)-N6)-threonylcarbamoyltransferase complex ATPase subunit type 1 TsaE [Candidatus Melainabacteria bacterium]